MVRLGPLFLAAVVAVGCTGDAPERVTTAPAAEPAPATPPAPAPPDHSTPPTSGPKGGGLAGGTGLRVQLACPAGIVPESKDFTGAVGFSMETAVGEGFAEVNLRWIGVPELLHEDPEWATWGIRLDDGSLVGTLTIVRTGQWWDPSHISYCRIAPPPPTYPPFTLFVSNQSFDHPMVAITVTLDGQVVVDDRFAVGSQHNFVPHELDVAGGEHRLRAVSGTGAALDMVFTTEPGQPLGALLSYWWHPDEGDPLLMFHTGEMPMGFA